MGVQYNLWSSRGSGVSHYFFYFLFVINIFWSSLYRLTAISSDENPHPIWFMRHCFWLYNTESGTLCRSLICQLLLCKIYRQRNFFGLHWHSSRRSTSEIFSPNTHLCLSPFIYIDTVLIFPNLWCHTNMPPYPSYYPYSVVPIVISLWYVSDLFFPHIYCLIWCRSYKMLLSSFIYASDVILNPYLCSSPHLPPYPSYHIYTYTIMVAIRILPVSDISIYIVQPLWHFHIHCIKFLLILS